MDNEKKRHRFDSIEDALHYSIELNGCQIFIGSCDSGYGYGVFKVGNIVYRAHRASYEFYKGKIPSDKIICHKCNVKLCINPDHLYAGTRKENAHDRMNYLRNKEAEGIMEIDQDNLNVSKEFINEIKVDSEESKKFTMIFPHSLYDQLKMMSVLTRKSMSDFIRISIIDKIKELKGLNR